MNRVWYNELHGQEERQEWYAYKNPLPVPLSRLKTTQVSKQSIREIRQCSINPAYYLWKTTMIINNNMEN